MVRRGDDEGHFLTIIVRVSWIQGKKWGMWPRGRTGQDGERDGGGGRSVVR